MCDIITDLLFELSGLHPALQNLKTGVKQLQACQILCTGNTDTHLLYCTTVMCIIRTHTYLLKAAIFFKAVAALYTSSSSAVP